MGSYPTANRQYDMCASFIYCILCLTTGPQPLPQSVLYTARSSASAFNLQYPPSSLRSSSSCLRLLPRLSVTSIFPSVCFRRQSLRRLWPIQLAFLPFTVCRTFPSSLTQPNISPFLTRSAQLIFSICDLYRGHYFIWPVTDVTSCRLDFTLVTLSTQLTTPYVRWSDCRKLRTTVVT